MLIVRQEKGSHWYLKDGAPFYQIAKLDGSGMRPTTIRDAFKAGAYRSVTNVLAVLAKPGLDAWKQEQCVLSALTLPRLDGEDEHKFAERAMKDSEEQAKKAADAGTALHDLAGSWLLSGTIPVSEEAEHREIGDVRPTMAVLLAPFQAWCQSNLDMDHGLVMPPESVMVNHQHGYAGRVDFPVRMSDGSIAILDLKTQDVKLDQGKKNHGQPKPAFYDEWAMQLAAYSRCIFADGSYPPPMPWRLISLVMDRGRPGLYSKEWTDPANPLPSAEPHFQAFLSAARVWSYLKGGTPGIDLKAA